MENVFQAPASNIEHHADGHAEARIWSWRGRIGRARFVAYCGLLFPFLALSGVLVALLIPVLPPNFMNNLDASTVIVLGVVIYLMLMLFIAFFASRRMRDMNNSAWLGLLVVLPYINFIVFLLLLFKAGDEGENRHGLPPAPNNLGVWISVLLTVLLLIVSSAKNGRY